MNNLTGAFDLMAEHYDDRYTENPSMALMRRRVQQVTTRYLQAGDTILELGSGTGEDAIFLAERGCRVLATDCSRNMLNLIQQKSASKQLNHLIRCQQLDIHNVASLNEATESFDGVFSNFGGLNTVQDLTALNTPLKSLLKPGGWFIACVMGRHCIWDWLVELVQLKFKNLTDRRNREGVVVSVGAYHVTCFFPSPAEFIDAFPGFEPLFGQALGLLFPPPRITGKFTRLQPLWTFLDILEQPISKLKLLQGCGDHFLLVLRRTE